MGFAGDITFTFTDYDICELVNISADCNRRRFYRIEIAPGLFGPLIIRAWGRLGCRVRVLVEHFDLLPEAVNSANRIYRQKIKKGYKQVQSLIEEKQAAHPVEIKKVRIGKAQDNGPLLPGFE